MLESGKELVDYKRTPLLDMLDKTANGNGQTDHPVDFDKVPISFSVASNVDDVDKLFLFGVAVMWYRLATIPLCRSYMVLFTVL